MKQLSIRQSVYLLPSLAGLFIGTSYIPFPPWALFFCLSPLFLFWLWNPGSAKKSFWAGWITQFILNLIGFHWIAYTASEFGHFPFWGGILTLLAYAALAHLHYAVTGGLGQYLRKKFRLTDLSFLFMLATLFAICDILLPKIFPWHLGYPWLWAHWPGAQFADVVGFEGLNIITIYVNAMMAWGLWNWFEHKNPRRTNMAVATGVMMVVMIQALGWRRAKPWRHADQQLDFLAVQGNIGNFDKAMAEQGPNFRTPIIDRYLKLTEEGLTQAPKTQIVLWPETAYPDLMDAHYSGNANGQRVRRFVREHHISLMTGAYSRDLGKQNIFNAFFTLDPDGVPQNPYRKTILLAFGETFPFSKYIPYMQKLLPDMGAFDEGSGPEPQKMKFTPTNGGPTELNVGPQICYEGLYPWFSAELARKGAQIFVNVTNDSWFGSDFEPYQHLYMTVARAIEFRRPLIRATNTGITTVALASGDLLRASPIHEEWQHEFRVPYLKNPGHTIYEKLNGLWIYLLFGILAGLLYLGRKKA